MARIVIPGCQTTRADRTWKNAVIRATCRHLTLQRRTAVGGGVGWAQPPSPLTPSVGWLSSHGTALRSSAAQPGGQVVLDGPSPGAATHSEPSPSSSGHPKSAADRPSSWTQTHGISGKERRLADVVEPQVELHDPFQAQPNTTMGRYAMPEGVDVRFQRASGHPELCTPSF